MKCFISFILAVLLYAVPVHAAAYVVNSSADSDDGACNAASCTLREAIHASNAAPGSTIDFAIASGPATITLGTSLPLITAATTIDATTQPGFSGTPLISITGPALTAFDVRASNTTVRGFALYAIGKAIVAEPTATISGVTIDANVIGSVSGAATTNAILLRGPVDGASITNNIVDGRGVTSSGISLETNTLNVVITGNRVTSCSNGIAVTTSGVTGNIRIGGTTPAERNVVGGCSNSGVYISSGSTNIVVEGNYIGTDVTGTVMNGNAFADVRLAFNGGGIVQNNVLSASVRGVYAGTGGDSVIRGNLIGLHADGVTTFSGTGHGIDVVDIIFIVIGGSTPAARNVIAVDGYGIWIHEGLPDFPVIQGNYIGLDANGTPAGNALKGIYINSSLFAPLIGGLDPGEGNAIGYAREECIYIQQANADAQIRGNLIGLNGSGTAPAGGAAYGIRANNIPVTIGGGPPGARNVISGMSNASATNAAIFLTGTQTALIQGNFIGTDITGNVAIGSPIGIDMQIGGESTIHGNTISGNTSHGIRKLSLGTSTITLNRIGTNAAGTAALPNGGNGIVVSGGVATITANVIANNGGHGIHLQTSNNVVGTTSATDSNQITSNGGAGVLVAGGTANRVVGNSIDSNGGLGIDLAPIGVTGNDPGDGDVGANNLQNAPVLTFATTSAGSTSISGSLNSAPSQTFTIELFSSAVPDPSGRGEGATFLGRMAVTTDPSGNAAFSFAAPAVAGGYAVSATARRDSTGDTSEFSNAVIATSPGMFQFTAPSESVGEGAGSVTLTVTRTGGFGVPGSVDYATSNGSAAAGSDYAPASGTLTFAAGETSKTIIVPILDDAVDEPDETFTVTLSNASLGAPSQTSVTITDDDLPPSIDVSDTSVTEGNSGTTTMMFTVTLLGVTTQQVTVDYTTTDGTATAGSDYGARFGTLTFAPGETSVTVAITVNGDTTAEANETVEMLLSSAVNAAIADGQGIGTIVNDDGNPAISIADVMTIEGNSGTSVTALVVSLSNPSSSVVSVDYATNGDTATSGSDFVAAGGMLTFNPGETAKSLSVTINGDIVVEGNESFFVDLSNPSNASIGDAQAVVTIADDDGSPSLTISNASVSESAGTAAVTVLLAPASAQTVTVSYTTSNGTAVAASDYTATSATLTFDPGETTQSILVPILNDNVSEATESFDVSLSAPSNAAIAGGDATVTIIDDDATPTLSASDVNATEGTTATFTVTLSNPSDSSVTVSYATANGTASAGDYTGAGGPLTFSPGETSKTVDVFTTSDAFNEPDESFFLNLSGATNATISRPQATATIVDDDGTPSIAIGDVNVTEGNSGTAMATFTVTLAGSTAQTVTVDYATADGTAIAGTDYPQTTGHLVFAPGVTTQTLQVPIIGDTAVEPDETFFVNLSSPVNATITDNQGLATILNDDVAAVVPSISINDRNIIEGDSGTSSATFTVTLSASTTNSVTVDFITADGAAAAGSDYASNAGTVVFAPGVTSQSITVAVAGDSIVEPNETYFVNLSAPVNATIADPQGLGTILNDDSAAVVPLISIGDASVPEGDSGTTNATFTVTLSAPTTNTVTVQYATANDVATSGSDYAAVSGTVIFAPGVTSQTITVAVAGDVLVEPNETYFVNLSAPANATIADTQGLGTILNDDSAAVVPSMSISDASVPEGDSGTTNATFIVTLSAPTTNTVTAQYATADDVATSGSDYAAVSGTVIFAPGVTSQTITVAVAGDALIEPNETYFVNLSAPMNATIADPQGLGTILNDDSAAVVPSISISDASVPEGDSGTTNATFTVTLSVPTTNTVTVQYATVDGTATAGSDYAAASGTLIFAPGAMTQTITIAVTGDALVEPDETYFVNLSAPVNATIAKAQGAGTIESDDGAGVLPSISIESTSVVEGNGATRNARFTVRLSAPAETVVTVQYTTVNGTATAGSDYAASSGTLAFPSGTTTGSITVAVVGDAIVEPNETFMVVLSSPVGATIADRQGVGTIINDDVAAAIPSLSVTGPAGMEGNDGTTDAIFIVALTAPAAGLVTVDYATSDSTATAGADYLATHGTLVFVPGQTSLQVRVPVVGDTVVESDETFTLTLANAVGATIGTASATGTIRDDDSGQVAAVLVIAGAGPGASQSYFRTTLQLLNPAAAAAITGNLVIHPMSGDPERTVGYALQPGEVREIGAQIEGNGFVTIDLVPLTGDLPEVSMRVYNDAGAAGTSGFTTSIVPVSDAIAAGRSAMLIAPANASSTRYNLGVRALSGGATVSFTLHRASGAVAARATRTLASNALMQIAAPMLFDTNLADNDWIEFTVTSGSAIVYGSAVDNMTQDPSLMIARPRSR